ncbi:hypothetical protein U1Q18_036697, partial [Sarracenia purpurea var. burkii]
RKARVARHGVYAAQHKACTARNMACAAQRETHTARYEVCTSQHKACTARHGEGVVLFSSTGLFRVGMNFSRAPPFLLSCRCRHPCR